jgi:hypothetical protein
MAATDERCALLSRDRGESLAGTASRVTRWVVVEQPGAWGQDALVDSKLDEQIGRTLKSAGLRHGFRPLLMRRPGWRKPEEGRRVYLARTQREGGWIEQVDFEDPSVLVRLDWEALESPDPPGIGVPGPAAVHLVCTNGRHDPCCADQGRPVVRALDDAGAEEVWESTHLGGDRFAANIATLPIGVYHGRVEAEQAVAVVGDVAAGLVTVDRYRGRSCFSPLAQAAEHFARIELGERRILGVTVAGAERRGADGLSVRFEHDTGTVDVVVRRERADRELLTCAASPARPWRYVLESLTR